MLGNIRPLRYWYCACALKNTMFDTGHCINMLVGPIGIDGEEGAIHDGIRKTHGGRYFI